MKSFDLGRGNFTQAVVDVAPLGVVLDMTPGNSDKKFTVPAGERWKLNHAFMTLTTSGVVGNRRLVMEVSIQGVLFGRISAGVVQGASVTRYYQYLQGIYRETSFINDEIQVPIPADVSVTAGAEIRIYDSAAIDVAGDNLDVRLSYQKFKGIPVPG
jgi:hypothetical protein